MKNDEARLSDIGELSLLKEIRRKFGKGNTGIVVGIGDDAAVVEPERNRLEVLSVDALVEGVHFDRRFTPASAIGHRALAVNLSDLAAMGAEPRLALLSLALPAHLPVSELSAPSFITTPERTPPSDQSFLKATAGR